jgi:hypothetical protein
MFYDAVCCDLENDGGPKMSEPIKWIYLSPCKHCGSRDIEFTQSGNIQKIQCQCCGVMVLRNRCDDPDDWPGTAIDVWNASCQCADDDESDTEPCGMPTVPDFLKSGQVYDEDE